MTYAYCRKPVSEVDNQSVSSVYQWAERYGLQIDKIYFEDEKNSKNTYDKRELGIKLLPLLKKGDYLILSEISCAGRSAQELDQLFNQVLYKKKVRFVCLSMNINIDFSNISQDDAAFLDKITFAAQLQTTIVKEYTSYALKTKIARGEKTGGGSAKWKESFYNKTKEQKAKERERRGIKKNFEFLKRKDTFVFLRILMNVFPNDTLDDNPNDWNWENINTKNGNYVTILSVMKQCHDIDPMLYSKLDFHDISSRQSQVWTAARLGTIRKSLKSAEKKAGKITIQNLFDADTIKALGITQKLMLVLYPNDNSLSPKKSSSEVRLSDDESSGIKISSDSISKFKSKK